MNLIPLNPEIDAELKKVSFFISANSNEQFQIWEEYKFEEVVMGHWAVIGYINDDKNMPVCLSFRYGVIFGHLICFYTDTSRFIDQEMIDEFIKLYLKTYDTNKQTKCKTSSFHLCYQYVSKYFPENNKQL